MLILLVVGSNIRNGIHLDCYERAFIRKKGVINIRRKVLLLLRLHYYFSQTQWNTRHWLNEEIAITKLQSCSLFKKADHSRYI